MSDRADEVNSWWAMALSTEQPDVTAQRNNLAAFGVGADRIEVHHGLPGTNRDRPACGPRLRRVTTVTTMIVTKFDRLAQSLPDARDILDELDSAGQRCGAPC